MNYVQTPVHRNYDCNYGKRNYASCYARTLSRRATAVPVEPAGETPRAHGRRLVELAGGWWLRSAGGWWLAGCGWLAAWWLVAGGWCAEWPTD